MAIGMDFVPYSNINHCSTPYTHEYFRAGYGLKLARRDDSL